jgi:hypothetical protein
MARGRPKNGVRHAPPIDIEYGSTGVILSPKAKAALLDFWANWWSNHDRNFGYDRAAPQSGTETRSKHDFYEPLERNLASFPNSHPTFIVGDLHARLRARFENETCCTGQHTFGHGLNVLIHNSSSPSFENKKTICRILSGTWPPHWWHIISKTGVKAGDLQRSWCARWTSLVPG